MIFMLVCTEGNVSEPMYIEALKIALGDGQRPKGTSVDLQVIPIPLGGNHGHTKLIQTAENEVNSFRSDENNLISIANETEDIVEKWLIVDYDDMESHGIDEIEFRKLANDNGYTLIINKPNFEFFVLAFLSDLDSALSVNKTNFTSEINAHIANLRDSERAKGFSESMLTPPNYSKKTFIADKLFRSILGYHPHLVEKALNLNIDTESPCYTEMPLLIRRMHELYNNS